MSDDDVLRDIKGYAAANRIQFTRHARERMAERNAQVADVRSALMTAAGCARQSAEKWKVTAGADLDGEALEVVVVIEDGVLVVTLMGD